MLASSAASSFMSGEFRLPVPSGGSNRRCNGERCQARIECRKQDIHPTFYPEAKVYCKGEHVLTVGGTKPEYVVDIWSGNHPAFQGKKASDVGAEASRLQKFLAKYGNQIKKIEETKLKFQKKQKKK